MKTKILRDIALCLLGGAAVYLAVATCTTSSPDASAGATPTTSSGARLKAKYYAAEDGAVYAAGAWFDSQLGVNCGFAETTDGKLRCVPFGDSATVYGDFADAACQQRVAQSCGSPKYASDIIHGTETICAIINSRWQFYAVAAPIGMGKIFSNSSGSCKEKTKEAGYNYYILGPKVPDSTFVAATVQTEK